LFVVLSRSLEPLLDQPQLRFRRSHAVLGFLLERVQHIDDVSNLTPVYACSRIFSSRNSLIGKLIARMTLERFGDDIAVELKHHRTKRASPGFRRWI
jgi:hypothetical protein